MVSIDFSNRTPLSLKGGAELYSILWTITLNAHLLKAEKGLFDSSFMEFSFELTTWAKSVRPFSLLSFLTRNSSFGS